jgi:hypothetical protein
MAQYLIKHAEFLYTLQIRKVLLSILNKEFFKKIRIKTRIYKTNPNYTQ